GSGIVLVGTDGDVVVGGDRLGTGGHRVHEWPTDTQEHEHARGHTQGGPVATRTPAGAVLLGLLFHAAPLLLVTTNPQSQPNIQQRAFAQIAGLLAHVGGDFNKPGPAHARRAPGMLRKGVPEARHGWATGHRSIPPRRPTRPPDPSRPRQGRPWPDGG